MTKTSSIDVLSKIVEALSPLESAERLRVVNAALVLLGETVAPQGKMTPAEEGRGEESSDLPVRTKTWMKQNDLTIERLSQVFHIADGRVEFIASSPGKDTKERTLNAYVLAGVAKLLSSGEPNFDDQAARALCKSSGCYDNNNHSAYLKGRGNEFTGTKETGWVLTAPGLKHAAQLIKELSK